MFGSGLGLFKRNKKSGPLVYLSEPTIIYHTQTEKVILEIIEEKLGSRNVILPSKYGLRSTSHMIKDAEIFVAVAIIGKFTSLVVREVKIAQDLGKRIHTLTIARKGNNVEYLFQEGIPMDIEWLSPEETERLYEDFRGEEFSGFMKFFIGDRRRSW
ncbi:hypothetical protein [Thermococcus sp.]